MQFQKAVLINISEDDLDDAYWQKFDQLVLSKVFLEKDDENIVNEVKDSDCLLVGFGVDVTKEIIDSAPNLKYIGVLATAYGKIDIEHAKLKNIPVCNLAGYSTESVAEFTVAVILECIRGLEEGKTRARSGNYSESGIDAKEIKNSMFGVIGLGSIGNRVAEIALGFGANVTYWSRTKKEVNLDYLEINDLIRKSDFISINLAETPETEGIFNEEYINSVKPGCVIVNTAPMELVNIDALAVRLAKNDIYFILDHSDEMSEEDLARLSKYPNCIIYPPIGYITDGARQSKQEMFVQNIKSMLEGAPENRVN